MRDPSTPLRSAQDDPSLARMITCVYWLPKSRMTILSIYETHTGSDRINIIYIILRGPKQF